MNMDKMKITVLDDGTIKVETDAVSGPNHMSAEAFLRQMSMEAGGEVNIARSGHGHHHHHAHGHEHHRH